MGLKSMWDCRADGCRELSAGGEVSWAPAWARFVLRAKLARVRECMCVYVLMCVRSRVCVRVLCSMGKWSGPVRVAANVSLGSLLVGHDYVTYRPLGKRSFFVLMSV